MTLRDLDCVPPPHDLAQVVQALKSDTTQWPAQAWVLHDRCSSKYGQAYPPKVAAVVTLRDLDCDPVPHDLVQVVQAPKVETTQWPAQLCVLHALCSSK